jgi:Carboxypeptidase regulatory-like domain
VPFAVTPIAEHRSTDRTLFRPTGLVRLQVIVVRLRWVRLALPVLVVVGLLPLRAAGAATAAGRVYGVVEDDAGAALPGAVVRLSEADGKTVATVTADGGGHYSAEVPVGTYAVDAAGPSRGVGLRARIAAVDVGADSPVDIVMAGGPGNTVHFDGRLRDADGAPLAGATLTLGPGAWGSTVTDSAGAFRLDARHGIYELAVTLPGPGGGTSLDSFTGFDLRHDRHEDFTVGTATFDVTVRDLSGAPVPGADVGLSGGEGCADPCDPLAVLHNHPTGWGWWASVTTDAAGHAHAVGIAGEASMVWASAPGLNSENEWFPAKPSNAVDLTMRPTSGGQQYTMGGTVTDSAGTPLDGVAVDIGGAYPSQQTAGGGRYSISAPAGPTQLGVSWSAGNWIDENTGVYDKADLQYYGLSVMGFRPETAPASLDLRLPVAPLTVRVLDRAGKPVAGALVTSRSDADADFPAGELFPGGHVVGGIYNQRRTGSDGVATVLRLTSRPAAVHVAPPPDRAAPADVTAPAGAATVDVHLPAGVLLTGKLQTADGHRGDFVHAGLVSADGRVRQPFKLAADGLSYRIVVPTGRYQLWTDDINTDPCCQSEDQYGVEIDSTSFAVTRQTMLDLTLPTLSGATLHFVDSRGNPVEADITTDSTAGPGTITLAPGIQATARAGLGVFGEASTAGAPFFPGGSLEATFDADPPVMLSGLLPRPNSTLVVAAAEAFELPADGGLPPGGFPPGPPPGAGGEGPSDRPGRRGYWALSSDGQVYAFGDAPALGNAAVGTEAVDIEPTPSGAGYWILRRNGTIAPFGDAVLLGDAGRARLAPGEAAVSLSATPSGQGYWVFTTRGRVLAFCDAPLLGDLSAVALNGPVLGSVATPSGRGYYMVAADGGIFAFGDAAFAGSMGGTHLNAPVTSVVPDGDGHGYWLVASDGGIFAFDAPFRGSMGGRPLNKPISGMVRYGDGYLMVGADGGVFDFSSSPFSGSLGATPPAAPVVAIAAIP